MGIALTVDTHAHITDYPHDLRIIDIGLSWVYFSWEQVLSYGPLHQQYSVTCNGTTFDTATTETSRNITYLISNTTYNCTVVVVSETNICSLHSPPVLLIPGKYCTFKSATFITSTDDFGVVEVP